MKLFIRSLSDCNNASLGFTFTLPNKGFNVNFSPDDTKVVCSGLNGFI